MTKFDKIRVIRELNLNSENSYLEPNKMPFDKVSIRTQWPVDSEKKTLHFPVVLKKDYNKTIKKIHDSGLQAIVSECIDPKDALFAGCIMRDYNKLIIEIANGPVTVRKVTHEGAVDERYIVNSLMPSTKNLLLNQVLVEIYRLERRVDMPDEYLFEFSYYNKNIGTLHQPYIFWELVTW